MEREASIAEETSTLQFFKGSFEIARIKHDMGSGLASCYLATENSSWVGSCHHRGT